MSEEGKTSKRKGGCLGKLATLFAFAGLGGLAAAMYFIAQPQDLSDIAGRGPGAVGKQSRDLRVVLQKAHESGYALTLTEEEINLYLRDTLSARQGGMLADHVTLDEVVVRLEKDVAEIILVRTVAGHPLTMSMYVRTDTLEMPDGTLQREISMSGGQYHESIGRPLIGGRFGQLKAPQGFIRVLLFDSMTRLASVYRDGPASKPEKELDCIEDMARIEIQDGKLQLDPRGTTRSMGLPGGF